jgi:hypothetical protein
MGEQTDTTGTATGGWLRSRFMYQFGKKQATHGIYAEIILLAVILALQGKRDDSDIVSTVLGALLAVILAEAYADYVGTMIGTGLRPTWPELRAQLALTFASLLAVVPPIVLLMLGVYGVYSLDAGFAAAKISGIVVIGAYAYVANRRAGLSLARSVVAALFLIALAAGLVLLKHYFH